MKMDVRQLATLSKLSIPEDEIDVFEKEMAGILDMVEQLPELECNKPLLDAQHRMQLRPDVVVPSSPREEVLQNAPKTAAGCFWVPKTVE